MLISSAEANADGNYDDGVCSMQRCQRQTRDLVVVLEVGLGQQNKFGRKRCKMSLKQNFAILRISNFLARMSSDASNWWK